MTGAKTELSYYTHCGSAIPGCFGVNRVNARCGGLSPEGKMSFPGEISHLKLKRSSNPHLTRAATWFPVPCLTPWFNQVIYCKVVTAMMRKTNPLMWDIMLWILKRSLPLGTFTEVYITTNWEMSAFTDGLKTLSWLCPNGTTVWWIHIL